MEENKEEEESVKETEEKIKKRQEKIINWLKDPHNLIFLGIIIFALVLRLHYFNVTINQAAWWDEADYLMNSRIFFGMDQPLQGYSFIVERPALIYILFGSLLKIGLSDIAIRFTEIIFSLIGITAVYFLGKEMFNKKVGLFASFAQAVFWQDLFFSQRFMLGIPSMAFGLWGFYFFWKGYVKKEIKRYWLPLGLFLGLSLITRHTGGLFLISIFVYLLLVERFKFLKQKDVWKALAIIIGLQVLSILSVLYFSKGNWISRYFFDTETEGLGGSLAGGMGFSGIWNYFRMMRTTYFGSIVGWMVLLALVYVIIRIALIADVILKSKSHKRSRELFLLIWILANIIFFGYFVNHIEPRYIMYAFPAIFILLGYLIFQITKKQKNLKIVILVAVIIALIIAFTQIKIANPIILDKAGSYLQVKESGYWINLNSEPGDIIISSSVPQHRIYSLRDVMWSEDDTEEGQIKLIKEYRPKYMVLSIFEVHQDWAYAMPQKYPEVFIPVQAYTIPQQSDSPALIIYSIDYSKIDLLDSNITNAPIVSVSEVTES